MSFFEKTYKYYTKSKDDICTVEISFHYNILADGEIKTRGLHRPLLFDKQNDEVPFDIIPWDDVVELARFISELDLDGDVLEFDRERREAEKIDSQIDDWKESRISEVG